MKNLIVISVVLFLGFGCAPLLQRTKIKAENKEQIACKASCQDSFRSCAEEHEVSCIAWSGNKCPYTAPAIREEINVCIQEESDCLTTCMR